MDMDRALKKQLSTDLNDYKIILLGGYYRDKYDREIDFVITENNRPIHLIEAKLSDSSVTKGLRYLKGKFPDARATVVHLKALPLIGWVYQDHGISRQGAKYAKEPCYLPALCGHSEKSRVSLRAWRLCESNMIPLIVSSTHTIW
ncbi:MAG: hypothetical protein BMS9Abin06_0708 [Gammaproteobacteria bacterium]|nr:MAG: hypothetical protein BMS9Abin06_0708 [Gammaproteobacteria bacterium]